MMITIYSDEERQNTTNCLQPQFTIIEQIHRSISRPDQNIPHTTSKL